MTVIIAALSTTIFALLYLVYVLAERNRRLVVQCKTQRQVIADMRTDWLDDGEVKLMPSQANNVDDWLADRPGVNPQAERNER